MYWKFYLIKVNYFKHEKMKTTLTILLMAIAINVTAQTGISFKANYQRRPDVPEITYRFSGYGGIFYRF